MLVRIVDAYTRNKKTYNNAVSALRRAFGRNPLLVAKEHGHRLTTMLSVYAAWTEGAEETDVGAIRDAMNRTDDREHYLVPKSGRDAAAPGRIEGQRRSDRRRFDVSEVARTNKIRFGSRFASSGAPSGVLRTRLPNVLSATL